MLFTRFLDKVLEDMDVQEHGCVEIIGSVMKDLLFEDEHRYVGGR